MSRRRRPDPQTGDFPPLPPVGVAAIVEWPSIEMGLTMSQVNDRAVRRFRLRGVIDVIAAVAMLVTALVKTGTLEYSL